MGRRLLESFFLFLVLTAGTIAFGAEDPKAPTSNGRVAAGVYFEVDSEGKANPDFALVVQELSPNIIHLRGKNGWIAFASFDSEKKEYRGFFEWPEIPGAGRPNGKWADLYQIKVVVKEKQLKIEGKSKENDLTIQAKFQEGLPKP